MLWPSTSYGYMAEICREHKNGKSENLVTMCGSNLNFQDVAVIPAHLAATFASPTEC